MKNLIIIMIVSLLVGCSASREDLIKKSKKIVIHELNAKPPYLFKLLFHSPVKIGEKYMLQYFRSPNASVEDRWRILSFFSGIGYHDLLLIILNERPAPDEDKLFCIYLLADERSKDLQKKFIVDFVERSIAKNKAKHILKNGSDFYAKIPFRTPVLDRLIKDVFINDNSFACSSAATYLIKNKIIGNRELLKKIKVTQGILKSFLFSKLDLKKDRIEISNFIRNELKKPSGTVFYAHLLLAANDLGVNNLDYYKIFKNPTAFKSPFAQIDMASIALSERGTNYQHYREYLQVVINESIKTKRYGDIIDLHIKENMIPGITKGIHKILRKGDEKFVWQLLLRRNIIYDEIPLFGKFLESETKEVRLLTALKILRAVELKQSRI